MFGLELVMGGDNSKIFLNPKNLIIPNNYKAIGYIIAQDKKVADEIQNFRDQEEINWQKKEKLLANAESFDDQRKSI